MSKQEFLARLRRGLSGLPHDDIEERLAFYAEMIDDRMEEGLSEAEAVAEIGDVDEIVRNTVADTPLSKIAKERMRPKRQLKAWEIVLLALGSPIWLSLGIAAIAVIIAVYASLWAVMIALWAVFGSLAVCAVGGIPMFFVLSLHGRMASGIAAFAAGLVCAGFAILMFFACKKATQGILALTKKITIHIKNRFIGKEEA